MTLIYCVETILLAFLCTEALDSNAPSVLAGIYPLLRLCLWYIGSLISMNSFPFPQPIIDKSLVLELPLLSFLRLFRDWDFCGIIYCEWRFN